MALGLVRACVWGVGTRSNDLSGAPLHALCNKHDLPLYARKGALLALRGAARQRRHTPPTTPPRRASIAHAPRLHAPAIGPLVDGSIRAAQSQIRERFSEAKDPQQRNAAARAAFDEEFFVDHAAIDANKPGQCAYELHHAPALVKDRQPVAEHDNWESMDRDARTIR